MAGEWGDLLSLDYAQPEEDLASWAQGGGMGAYAGGAMPAYSGGYADLGAGLGANGGNYTGSDWYGDQGGFGGGFDLSKLTYGTPEDYGASVAPQRPQTADILSSRDMYTPEQMKGDAQGNIANPFAKDVVSAPQTGQMGGSAAIPQRPKAQDESWLKLLGKTGIQAAGGLATGLIGSALQGKPQQPNAPAPVVAPSPLPQAPSTAIPTQKEMEPLPGTNASPLISGRPTKAIGSSGLNVEDRIKKGGTTGGFQLY